jgi:hypothetical protein
MGDWIFGRWLALKGSGWFAPSKTGGLFPVPETWQGWLATGVLIVALAASGLTHGEPIILTRIVMCVLYIALGFLTYA